MKERGILFSGAMVRALLAGTKTQTRRVMRHQPKHGAVDGPSPYGVPGDRLWVRETWQMFEERETMPAGLGFRADLDHCGQVPVTVGARTTYRTPKQAWVPSIHMPRRYSRITLEVTEVRVQRLQAISPDDAAAEGIGEEDTYCGGECEADPCSMLVPAYARLWDSINGDRAPWAANPWVWAVSFRRVQP